MFYEIKHLAKSGQPIFEKGEDFSYPPHIHSCFEILIVTSGEMNVSVGDECRVLKENEGAMIFPNKVHSMESVRESKHTLCIFSPGLVNYYSRKVQNLLPESAFFTIPKSYTDIFSSLSDSSDTSTAKGILYLLCGHFDKTASYIIKEAEGNEGLLYSLLKYIESNFPGVCTLRDAVSSLNYDYAYISKFFKRSTGISFNDYVNRRRINEACRLLETTNKTVLAISMECGYNSLRSFNRNFKEQTGTSPMKYGRQST